MSKIFLTILGLAVLFVAAYYFGPMIQSKIFEESGVTSTGASASASVSANIDTNFGLISAEFFPKNAPKTVANFVKLAKDGFYNGLTFHRVIPGFMIQGGDPNCGKNGGKDTGFCGGGGPGYKFEDEINPASDLYSSGYKKGILAMANSGPNTNGSQFFIMVNDMSLPPNYTIFGRVTAGQDVADKISSAKRNQNDRPLEPAIMKSVSIIGM